MVRKPAKRTDADWRTSSVRRQVSEPHVLSLLEAINRLHNTSARFIDKTSVREVFDGDVVWEGEVYVFELKNHPAAKKAYAWSSPIEGSDKRKFYAVLHEGPIKTPADAVRAAIVKDYQDGEGK